MLLHAHLLEALPYLAGQCTPPQVSQKVIKYNRKRKWPPQTPQTSVRLHILWKHQANPKSPQDPNKPAASVPVPDPKDFRSMPWWVRVVLGTQQEPMQHLAGSFNAVAHCCKKKTKKGSQHVVMRWSPVYQANSLMEQPYQRNWLDSSRGTGCEGGWGAGGRVGGWQLLVQQNNNRGATRREIFHTCQAAMLKLNKVCVWVYVCVFYNIAVWCYWRCTVYSHKPRGSQRGEETFNVPL